MIKTPLTSNQIILKAKQYESKSNYQEAINLYKEILKNYPKNTLAKKSLLNLQTKIKNSQKQTISQEQLKDLEVTYHQGNSTTTLKKAVQLNKIDPNSIFINSVIAISLRNLNRLEESLEYFIHVVKLDPNSADAYSNVGVVLNGLKRYDEAVEYYTKAIELDPKTSSAYSNLGNVLRELGRYQESIEYCKKAINIKPDFSEAYNNLGFALIEIGENDEALINFDKAIESNPSLADAYSNKAAVLIKKKDYNGAIKNSKISIRLNKNNSNPYYALGAAYMYTGEFEKSLINLKQSLAIDKTDLNVYTTLFELYVQTNNHSKLDIEDNIKDFQKINNIKNSIVVIVYYAINKLIDAEIENVKILLNNLKPFINNTSLDSLTPISKTFVIAYYRYLTAITNSIDPNLQIDRSLQRIYHIGESHSLSFANQTLTIEEKRYLIKPCIIIGAKAFHFSKTDENDFKFFFQNHIKNIPDNSKIIISIGEIDCRSDEGIIPYHLKSGKSIDEIIHTTITGYINYVQTLLKNRNITPYFTAVPAPVVKEEIENELLRIEVVQKFNQTLKQELDKLSLNFLDTHSFTTNEKGSSNLEHMCDDFHLSPKAINEFQALFDALNPNKIKQKKISNNTIDQRTHLKKNTDGYTDNVDYTYGYYPYWTASKLKLACIQRNIEIPTIRNACELGFGQGVSMNLLACTSEVKWYGTDFNTNHANYAQTLADTTKNGAKVYNMSFEEFNNVEELPKFDLIAIHGIYSWIDEKNQAIINDFIDKHLSEKGMVYISYNTKPGTDAFRPAQHIIKEVVEQLTTNIESTDDKIKATLNWMEKFHTTNPAYLNAFATIKTRLDTFKGGDVSYIYHEYLNDNWFSFYFSEMAKRLAPIGLKYLGQSQYNDDLNILNYTNEQVELFKDLPTPLKEDIQDSMTNTQFRKDIWMRDANTMPADSKQEFIKNQQVILSAPHELVNLEIKGKRLQINLGKEFYQVVVDLLADYQPKTIESIKQELNFSDAQIIEIITVLNSIGMVALVADTKSSKANQTKCDAFNKIVLEEASNTSKLKLFASSVIAEAISVSDLIIHLMIKGYQEGITTQKDLVQYVVSHYIKKGLGLKTPEGGVAANKADLSKEMKPRAKVFIDTWLPFFKAHGIM